MASSSDQQNNDFRALIKTLSSKLLHVVVESRYRFRSNPSKVKKRFDTVRRCNFVLYRVTLVPFCIDLRLQGIEVIDFVLLFI